MLASAIIPPSSISFSSFSKRLTRSISELSLDPNEAEELVFSPISEDLAEKAPSSRLSVETSSCPSTTTSAEAISMEDQTRLSNLHSFIESAYPRILELDLNPFKHIPFKAGGWAYRYLTDSEIMAKNWLATHPKLNKSDSWRFTIFQTILRRSSCPAFNRESDYRVWGMRTVSRLRLNHEVWFDLLSGCGSKPLKHTMILKIMRISSHLFKIVLVNIGYSCIKDKRDKGYCRDLVTIANSFYEREFYDFLRKIFSKQPDVPCYYSIIRNTYPDTTRLGSKRPIMRLPLCATETYKRCYKDFLGKRLYASWMSYWTEKELSIIEAQINTKDGRIFSQLNHTDSPATIKVNFIPAGTTTAPNKPLSLNARMYSLSDVNQFLKAATLTHRRYLAFSAPTRSFKANLFPLKNTLNIQVIVSTGTRVVTFKKKAHLEKIKSNL